MVATADCDRPKAVSSSNKVSKPLMEKKRRARINQCLDQLKCLLESHYSTTIRKRKMEKADILELTVRYLKHLQKIQKFSSVAPESDYQSGFRSCVSTVNQYLLTAERVNGAERWELSRLSSRLSARRPEDDSSTMDSSGHARLPSSASGSEESNVSTCKSYSSTAHSHIKRQAQKNSQTANTIHCEVLKDHVWRPW